MKIKQIRITVFEPTRTIQHRVAVFTQVYEADGHVSALDKFRSEHPEYHDHIAIAETLRTEDSTDEK